MQRYPDLIQNWDDPDGNPGGGVVSGIGFVISWQNGPLGRGAERRNPNGAFVEAVIYSCVARLQYYQDSKFACEENQQAMEHLQAALNILDERTKRREAQGVEGLAKGN